MSIVPGKHDFQHFWADRDEVAVLTFNLNGETFAIEAITVQEIIDLLPETKVPGAKPFVSSVINFRGKVIPLADIRLAFGMEATEPTIDSRIIVIELDLDGETTLTGIRTDRVFEVTTLAHSASEPPPASACVGVPTSLNAWSNGMESSSFSPISRQFSPAPVIGSPLPRLVWQQIEVCYAVYNQNEAGAGFRHRRRVADCQFGSGYSKSGLNERCHGQYA